jgi:hypothetical protein
MLQHLSMLHSTYINVKDADLRDYELQSLSPAHCTVCAALQDHTHMALPPRNTPTHCRQAGRQARKHLWSNANRLIRNSSCAVHIASRKEEAQETGRRRFTQQMLQQPPSKTKQMRQPWSIRRQVHNVFFGVD